jgi:ADP-ribose pyrophosphatase YjhB (NUDIX family)
MTFVSALIQDVAGPTGKVLICRKEGGAWQLPACKVFTSERPECAVARLAREQLGIGLKVGKLAMIGRHLRPETDTKHDYHEYYEAVNLWQKAPKSDVYREMIWVSPSELSNYEFEGDDKSFMAKYVPWINCKKIPDVRMY